MTEQPEDERVEEQDEPTQTWAPAEVESEQPAEAPADVEQDYEAIEDAIEEGMPLAPQDEEPEAAEPEPAQPQPRRWPPMPSRPWRWRRASPIPS